MVATSVNAGARLDRLPVSGFHWRMLALIGAGLFLDGFEIYLAGGVLGALVKEGWSNLALNAQFMSFTFGGMVVGAWLAGIFGDKLGRRYSYQLNLLVFGLAALAGAFAPSMTWLIAARFVMGLGLGAEIVVGYAMILEFVPPAQRGRWGAGLGLITNSALFISSLVSYYIIPSLGWRWMFGIVGVAALIIWFLRRAMPESPRWLEATGRFEEAERVLLEIEAEVGAKKPLPPPAPAVATVVAKPQSVWALFTRAHIAQTITGSMMLISMNTAIYGFIAWLPTFFIKQGLTINSSLGLTTIMSIGGPVGVIIGIWLSDYIGRKRGVIVFSIVAAALGMLYPFASTPTMVAAVGFSLVTLVYILVAFWAVYVPELFPTPLRLRGNGVCNTIGRVTGMITPFIVVFVFTSVGVIGVVTLLASLLVLAAIVVAILGIETKSRPLDEIGSAVGSESLRFPVASGTSGSKASV